MIHSTILPKLKELNLPLSYGIHEGDDETYITWIQYDESASMNADDDEYATNFYYQINIFSKSDYSEIVQSVKQKMKDIGGIRITENDSLSDGYYQRSIRFKFTKTN